MGIALQTAVREIENKKRSLPVFELRLVQLPHFGDACAIFVGARNPVEARILASQLYTMDEIPDKLKEASHSLVGIDRVRWRSSKFSICRKTNKNRRRTGVVEIEIRK